MTQKTYSHAEIRQMQADGISVDALGQKAFDAVASFLVPPGPNREGGAQEAPAGIDATLSERGSRYGEFLTHAAITQVLKSSMRGTLLADLSDPKFMADVELSQGQLAEKWLKLRPDTRECLEMLQHKIGRALNGDPEYDDNFRDIQGYSKLVLDRIVREQGAG